MAITGFEYLKVTTKRDASRWFRAGLFAALLTGPVAYAVPAHAQNQQNFNSGGQPVQQNEDVPPQAIDQLEGSAQRLPDNFATQQLPPTFAMDNEAQPPQDSGQIIPARQGTDSQNGDDMIDENPEEVPEQPETRRLVPATAMGAGAQTSETPANPVENSARTAQEPAAALPEEIMERYGAGDTGAEDALPTVDDTTMSALQGEFDGLGAAPIATGPAEMSEAEKQALQEDIRREAFDAAITGMFPLTPEQIKTLRGKYDETQRAVNEAPSAPRPEISVTNISLDPGVMPPTLKTAVGNVTTVNILDATGAPWPVQDVTWAGDFEIVEPEQGGHIIRITPMSQFARGNLVVRLLTLKTPLTLTLETSRDVVQYRVDARIPEYGPFATAPLMQGGTAMVAGDSTLMSLLDGVAPNGMIRMDVSGVDGRTTAYSMNGMTYVRTPLTLLSPAWKSSVSSADGMHVYALSSAPVLLLSDEGQFMRASLKEKEELLDE